MGLFEIPPSYLRDCARFIKAPLAFLQGVDFSGRIEMVRSMKYLGFAFFLTSGLVLFELNLIPEQLIGSLGNSVEKEELVFSYWASVAVFVLAAHVATRILSGQARLRATASGLFRVYSFLFPGTTLVMIILSQIVGRILDVSILVTPPLGVIALEPMVPTTGGLLLLAAWLTAYIYLALFLIASTVWVVRAVQKLSYPRTLAAFALSAMALALSQPPIIFCVRKIFGLFGPLIKAVT